MITKYKKQIQPLIAIIAQPFLSWNPHILTICSVLFAALFALSFGLHLYILALLCWIGVLFDAFDGYVARKRGKVTQFGAFFDSTMDRIADFFYIAAFGFAGIIPWWFVVFGLLTTFLISYTKARGESLTGVTMHDGFMQRSERLLGLFFIFLSSLWGGVEIALLLFSLLVGLNIVTILQRVIVIKNLLGK